MAASVLSRIVPIPSPRNAWLIIPVPGKGQETRGQRSIMAPVLF